MMKKQQVSKAI